MVFASITLNNTENISKLPLTSNILISARTYSFRIPSDFPNDANNIVIPRTIKNGGKRT